MKKLVVLREVFPGERRVAITPGNVEKFKKLGFDVAVQSEAGLEAGFDDAQYAAAGALIAADAKSLLATADVILKVRAPSPHEITMCKPGVFLASLIAPAQNPEILKSLAAAKISTAVPTAAPAPTTESRKVLSATPTALATAVTTPATSAASKGSAARRTAAKFA